MYIQFSEFKKRLQYSFFLKMVEYWLKCPRTGTFTLGVSNLLETNEECYLLKEYIHARGRYLLLYIQF